MRERAQANLRRNIEMLSDDIKTGVSLHFRKSMAGTYQLAMRCPVYRRRGYHLGSGTELENLAGDAKGESTSGEPARLKVPMRRRGADCPVLVMKRV